MIYIQNLETMPKVAKFNLMVDSLRISKIKSFKKNFLDLFKFST